MLSWYYLQGFFKVAFDIEHMKIYVSGKAKVNEKIYDEIILQDFPNVSIRYQN
jgi:hypothetical protein